MNDARATPSLRRRLLAFLLIPVGLLLVLDAIVTYEVALAYSNRVHDKDLQDDARTLAELLRTGASSTQLSRQARFLLEYDPDGRGFFEVTSAHHGLIARNAEFPGQMPPPSGQPPRLFDARYAGHTLRGAIVSLHPQSEPSDTLAVAVAETLRDRRERAREILLLTIPLQTLLTVGVLSLVWFGVDYGLRVLRPLTARLARRETELNPIGTRDVPREILPLTRTIDALFARQREMLVLQERFIADAAHQLRTPLAGLALHADQALAATGDHSCDEAMEYIRTQALRVGRTASQLLALTRAQVPRDVTAPMTPVDLARMAREAVAVHVPEALRKQVDLGAEATASTAPVLGDAAALQELLDNLIGNALTYAGRGSRVTVVVALEAGGAIHLRVEDDGPGIAAEWLPRLGERFFRVPGGHEGGTGLGLAIVQRIAHRHHASVEYANREPRGFVVDVCFPPLAA